VVTKKKKLAARKTPISKPAKKKKATAKKKPVSRKKKPVSRKKKPVSRKKKPAAPKKKTAKKASKKKAVKKRAVSKKPIHKKKTPAKKAVRKPLKKTKTATKNKSSSVKKKAPKNLSPLVLKIKTKLLKGRSELLGMIRSSQEVERNVGDITFSNEIDLASSLEGREMAFQLSSRERNELRLIEDALFKIASGNYGVCEGCSKVIGVKRLQILPLTSLCIQCQENLEVS